MSFVCDICNFNTKRRYNLDVHRTSQKHIDNGKCKECFEIFYTKAELRKHRKICEKNKTECNEEKPRIVDQKISKQEKIVGKLVTVNNKLRCDLKQLRSDNQKLLGNILETNKKLVESNIVISNNAASVTNNAINTSRAITCKLLGNMKVIVERFPNAPPIQRNETDVDETLLNDVLAHYSAGTIVSFFGNSIIEVYKKEDSSQQSLWTTDCSRLHYAVKMLKDDMDKWISDKGGKVMGSYAIVPMLKHIQQMILKELTNPAKIVSVTTDIHSFIKRRESLTELLDMIESGRLETDISRFISTSFSISSVI